jgi:hypothetical protein
MVRTFQVLCVDAWNHALWASWHGSVLGIILVMKTRLSPIPLILAATTVLSGTLLADSPVREVRQVKVRREQAKEQPKEVTVFVTGSMIPKRIKLEPVGTTTVSPIRYIDRAEIDSTGRFTTAGAFVNEPSVRIIGH